MSPDELDQPEQDGFGLVVPFIVCQSAGGPFEDDAFCAGFEAGRVDQALAVAAAANAATVRFPMTRTALLKQFDLIGMNRGYPVVDATESDEYPEWCDVVFAREVS